MNKKNGLSKCHQEKIMRAFCADISATQAALLLGYNRNTINRYYTLFRQKIYRHQKKQKDAFVGTVEVDESYFGRTRPCGTHKKLKRGRGTTKQPVFGIFERGGRVYRHKKTKGLAPWMKCVQYLLHAFKKTRPLCV